MISHITLGSNNIARARHFYEAVMSTLGIGQPVQLPDVLVFGREAGPRLWIVPPFDGGAASHGNGTHVALLAATRSEVDAFHVAALAHGGSDEGAPGRRPHYSPNYYAAYVRDPDGNKLQAVCHHPQP